MCGSIKNGIELDRGLRTTTSRDTKLLTDKVSQLLTVTSALTTQVNNLTSTVAQAGFSVKQGTLVTDTRLPQAAPQQRTQARQIHPQVKSKTLIALRQAIDMDIEGATPAGVVDKERALLGRVEPRPDLISYYQALSETTDDH